MCFMWAAGCCTCATIALAGVLKIAATMLFVIVARGALTVIKQEVSESGVYRSDADARMGCGAAVTRFAGGR